MSERVPVPLSLLHRPFCVTFSFFAGSGVSSTDSAAAAAAAASAVISGDGNFFSHGGENYVLLDATAQEESLRHGDMTITMNKNGEVCQIAKNGGLAVEAHILLNCANVAAEKVKIIDAIIERELRRDELERNKGNLDWLKESKAENDR